MKLTLDEQQDLLDHCAVCGTTQSGKRCVTELLGSAWFSVQSTKCLMILAHAQHEITVTWVTNNIVIAKLRID